MGIVETVKQGLLGSVLSGVLLIVGGFGLLRALLPVLARVSETVPQSGTVLFLLVLFVYGGVVRLTLGLGIKSSLIGCLAVGGSALGVIGIIATLNILIVVQPDYQFLAISILVAIAVYLLGFIVGERFRSRLANRLGRELLLTTYFTSIEPTPVQKTSQTSDDGTETDYETAESTESEDSS